MSSLLYVFTFLIIETFFLEVFYNATTYSLTLYFMIFMTLGLFILQKIKNKNLVLPKITSYLFGFFIFFSFISLGLSVDKSNSLEQILIYINCFLIFVFVNNHKKAIGNLVPRLLIGLALLFTGIWFFDIVFNFGFITRQGIFNLDSHHSQIGNIIVLVEVLFFYQYLKNKKSINIILFIIFFPFLLFSYSRIALISLILIMFILIIKNRKSLIYKQILLIGIVSTTLIIGTIIGTTREFRNKLFPENISKYLLIQLNIPEEKSLFGLRDKYYYYALSSIKEKPFFGLGPGNFAQAAYKKYTNPSNFSGSAHNIFLELTTTNGIFAGLFFLLFVIWIIKKKEPGLNFYIFITLTIIFLIDFSYINYSFLLLWFILGGLTLDGKEHLKLELIYVSATIFIVSQIILLSNLLLFFDMPKEAVDIYPWGKEAYIRVIEESLTKKDKKTSLIYINKYKKQFNQTININEIIEGYLRKREEVR